VSGDRIAFVNARLLDPASGLDETGALLVQDGEIADFGPDLFSDGAPSVRRVVDCEGKCLAPGLVDIRVQLREPGDEHKETFETGGDAAASGGVTTMVCLPNTNPVIDDVSVVEFIARRAQEAKRVNVYCYGSITTGLSGTKLTEMGLLSEAGALAFTDGERAVSSAIVMRRALSYAKGLDLTIVQHPEEPALANGGVMNEGEVSTRLGLAGIPAQAEVMMIERDLRLVELTGGRYHAAHISTAAAVEAIRRGKERGLPITCDTAPNYFALNETAIGDYRTFAKISPPLRDENDRLAVIEGLADGTIDIVASDHSPHDQDSKRLPFDQAAYGAVGLETLLPLTLNLYHDGRLSLLEALGKITAAPAKLMRLSCGTFRKGAPADLVIFDPGKPWQVKEEQLRSKSKNTPFDGHPVQGNVLHTLVAGRSVFEAHS
jgi:dihydroorotase